MSFWSDLHARGNGGGFVAAEPGGVLGARFTGQVIRTGLFVAQLDDDVTEQCAPESGFLRRWRRFVEAWESFRGLNAPEAMDVVSRSAWTELVNYDAQVREWARAFAAQGGHETAPEPPAPVIGATPQPAAPAKACASPWLYAGLGVAALAATLWLTRGNGGGE